ncbi:MAG: TetR/AcrR family transcriptional regulator [Spirochaetota bacterium]
MARSGYPSDSARRRDRGLHQVDERRECILDAAQTLFVERGIEQTSMRDIAAASGITPVTLYRYFPDRHPIAIEIAARMVGRIVDTASRVANERAGHLVPQPHRAPGDDIAEYKTAQREIFCHYCLAMIDQLREIRDAYRYIGNFDHLYAGAYPSTELARYYRRRLREAVSAMPALDLKKAHPELEPDRERMVALTNVIMSYLEKMAARGALMGREQRVPLRRQIRHFRSYVESVLVREFDWQPELDTTGAEARRPEEEE